MRNKEKFKAPPQKKAKWWFDQPAARGLAVAAEGRKERERLLKESEAGK